MNIIKSLDSFLNSFNTPGKSLPAITFEFNFSKKFPRIYSLINTKAFKLTGFVLAIVFLIYIFVGRFIVEPPRNSVAAIFLAYILLCMCGAILIGWLFYGSKQIWNNQKKNINVSNLYKKSLLDETASR